MQESIYSLLSKINVNAYLYCTEDQATSKNKTIIAAQNYNLLEFLTLSK